MEGIAKINFASYLLSNEYGHRFSSDFGVRLGAILGPNRPSEAIPKASVIKYENEEGSKSFDYPPPTKIFSFASQCERETGRASQADVAPYGVGGFLASFQWAC